MRRVQSPSTTDAGATPPLIRGAGVVKSWGANRVHDGLDFAIHAGVTGLLGSNGSGKTTLLGMLLGLHRPDVGVLEVLGLDPTAAGPDIRARVGYAPEHHILPPDVRAHDFVRHMAEVHGLPKREATGRASDALWQVGLGEERFRPIGTMSTGQRQRVKLAQAIAHDPVLVMLDEPTDGLDPVQRDDMLTLIQRCGTEFGISVLLSSHLLEEVERVCQSAVILGNGRVIANGTLDDLRGEGQGVDVVVDDDPAPIVAALDRAGLQVDVDGRSLVVHGNGDEVFDHIRDAIAASGIGIRRLEARRISLEDVFLDVTYGDPNAEADR